MSERLPRVIASQVIRVLERLGFELARQSGSHRIYRNAEGRRVTVPFHTARILHPKILSSILTDADITAEEFRRLL